MKHGLIESAVVTAEKLPNFLEQRPIGIPHLITLGLSDRAEVNLTFVRGWRTRVQEKLEFEVVREPGFRYFASIQETADALIVECEADARHNRFFDVLLRIIGLMVMRPQFIGLEQNWTVRCPKTLLLVTPEGAHDRVHSYARRSSMQCDSLWSDIQAPDFRHPRAHPGGGYLAVVGRELYVFPPMPDGGIVSHWRDAARVYACDEDIAFLSRIHPERMTLAVTTKSGKNLLLDVSDALRTEGEARLIEASPGGTQYLGTPGGGEIPVIFESCLRGPAHVRISPRAHALGDPRSRAFVEASL